MKCYCSNNLNLCLSNSQRNPGRLFFKCGKRQCDFFQWADEYRRGHIRLWLEGEKFITLSKGRVVKRKPQNVLFETPLQKGVRESIDKYMIDTTPRERLYLNKRGLATPTPSDLDPFDCNWESKNLVKNQRGMVD